MNSFKVKEEMSEQEINDFVEYAINEMNLKEKIQQMSGYGFFKYVFKDRGFALRAYPAAGLKRLDIPSFFFTDGPRGVIIPGSTCFPVSMARGASWDIQLEEKVGDVIGKEVRAHGGTLFGGVCINLLRHPAWGRAQETYGEDPFLLGELGAALVRGVQKHNVMATIKHYAANSIENARFKVNIKMDQRTLREVYLPHFKRCVNEGCASVMSAYNKVRGEYCGHNKYLLKDILKEEWKFKGFVHSDWMWGLRDSLAGITGGLDVEMPRAKFYGKRLKKLVEKGKVPLDLINDSVRRVISTILKFTSKIDPIIYDRALISCKEHRDIALEVAEKSMVLLKNRENLLPLNLTHLKNIAVVGPLATLKNTGDHGSSNVKQKDVITPLTGIKNYVQGKIEVHYSEGSDLEEARKLASTSDVIIVVVGYTYKDEGEWIPFIKVGGDRENLNLLKEHINLIKAIAEVNSKTIVVLVGGSAIMMEDWKEQVSTIIMAWYSGMRGGDALSRIIFGEVNPSGKLPFTIPKDASDLPFFDKNVEEIEYGYYHGYTKFDKEQIEPAFPFGFGMSYTKYIYQNLRVETTPKSIIAKFDVMNIGRRTGDEVVQLYIGFKNSAIDRPKKLLKGFTRVNLIPGEKKQVELRVDKKDITWYNPDIKQWELEKMEYELYVGGSSKAADLLDTIFTIS